MSSLQFALTNQLTEANGSRGLFDLPCGYFDEAANKVHTKVEINALTGVEEDIMASRNVPQNEKMNRVLNSCIRTIGEFSEREHLAGIIPDLLLGDRTFLFFALRLVTHGPLFPFRKKCPECQNISTFNYDLSELPVYPMPNPEKRLYETKLPHSGKVVVYRPLTGRDELQRDRLRKRMEPLTLSLYLRIEEFDGRPVDSGQLQRLTAADRDFLRAEFEEIEGGIETSIDLKCQDPSCGAEFETEIDPSDPAFFSPSATQRRWKRRSSSS